MEYWLRGGIAAAAIFILLLILSVIIPSGSCKPLPEGQVMEDCRPVHLSELLLLPGYPLLDILDLNNDLLAMSTAFLGSVVFSFLIGALIGWSIEKIKK